MTLTEAEWKEYTDLIDSFCKAKLSGDYEKSDILRKELRLWQRPLSDSDWLAMYHSGEYLFIPAFEQCGINSHYSLRIKKRSVAVSSTHG